MKSVVAIVSGGLDSVTLAYLLSSQGYSLHLLAFDYGQRHVKEVQCAQLCAQRLGATFDRLDLRAVGEMLTQNSLTSIDNAVPDGHYTDSTMKVTVVPNRNAIMLTVAFGIAANYGYDAVAIGVHGGDHTIYPDCRPEFLARFSSMEETALGEWATVKLLAPFVEMDKTDIVRLGIGLGVPFIDTWSCYKGREAHCGTCGTCVERKEAFSLAGMDDPTVYVV